MKKYIDVSKKVRQEAMRVFGVTERTVINALYFDQRRGYSDRAKRIRSYAIQNGGVTMVVSKEVETLYDADGYIRQYFPNEAMLEINKNDGTGDIYHRGKKVVHYDTVIVRDIDQMQNAAMAL